jgi:hypothetical protein
MASQPYLGQEEECEVEDVCHLHKPQQGMPQRTFPFALHRPSGRFDSRVRSLVLSTHVLWVPPDSTPYD